MAVVEHAVLTVDDERAAEFERAFATARPDLQAAQGASEVALDRSLDDARRWLLRVRWERIEDHLEGFPASEAGRRFVAAVSPYFAEPPIVVHVPA